MFVVEELDDLLGDCSLDVASAVGRNDEDVGLIDVKESVSGEKVGFAVLGIRVFPRNGGYCPSPTRSRRR